MIQALAQLYLSLMKSPAQLRDLTDDLFSMALLSLPFWA